MNNTFKKVLSVILSLAMVLTSVTVFDITAKADDVANVVVTAEDKGYKIDASWSHPDVAYASEKYYLNEADNIVLDDNHFARNAPAGWTWSVNSPNEIRTMIDGVTTTHDTSIDLTKGGSFVITVVYFDAEGNVVAQGTSNVVEIAERVIVNTDLNATISAFDPTVHDNGPTVSWELVANATRYELKAVDDATDTVLKTWGLGENATSQYYWCSDVSGNAGETYTLVLTAYDAAGNVVATESIEAVAKYYDATVDPGLDPDTTEIVEGYQPLDYAAITKWTPLGGVSASGATVSVSDISMLSLPDQLGGFYDAQTVADWNNVAQAAIYNVPVIAFVHTTGAVAINGIKYTNAANTKNVLVWKGGNDCVYINQSIIDAQPNETNYYTITFDDGVSVALKVEGHQQYSVTVDGVATKVTEGNTYTLGDAAYGYYSNGEMYKAGTTITVTGDVTFTSVNNLDVVIANGAAVKTSTPTGLKFQASVVTDNAEAVQSDAITEGMLITANDIFENNDSVLDLTSAYTVMNIENTGWANSDTLTYYGAVVNIAESNYTRDFVAKAYVTVTYTDGSAVTYYSGVAEKRNVSQVASRVVADANNGLSEAALAIVSSFIK